MSNEMLDAIILSSLSVSGAGALGFACWLHGRALAHAEQEVAVERLVFDIATELRGGYGTCGADIREMARGLARRSLQAGRSHADTLRIVWRVKRSLLSKDLLLEDERELAIFFRVKGTAKHNALSAPYKLRNWLVLAAKT